MNKIYPGFAEAVADIFDGASVAVYNWGFPGIPQNLLLAVRDQGARDLTVITPNWFSAGFPEEILANPNILLPQMKKLIASYFSSSVRLADKVEVSGETVELEKNIECVPLSHGILVERLRAAAGGMGPFYCPVGVGTKVEDGKEKRVFDGKEYLLEYPLKPDFGIIKADKADRYGNLVYRGVSRGINPIIAMASTVTIVEVDEIVEPGELDPDAIVTPAVFVDRIVKIPEGGRGSFKDSMTKFRQLLEIPWVRDLILGTKKEEDT